MMIAACPHPGFGTRQYGRAGRETDEAAAVRRRRLNRNTKTARFAAITERGRHVQAALVALTSFLVPRPFIISSKVEGYGRGKNPSKQGVDFLTFDK